VAPAADRKDSLDLFFGGSLRWRERLGFRLTEKLDEDRVDVVDGSRLSVGGRASLLLLSTSAMSLSDAKICSESNCWMIGRWTLYQVAVMALESCPRAPSWLQVCAAYASHFSLITRCKAVCNKTKRPTSAENCQNSSVSCGAASHSLVRHSRRLRFLV
jgi:hypothetical protein